MIVHSVKFERPISGASLVDCLTQPDRALDSCASSANDDSSPGSASTSTGEDSQAQANSETIEKLLSEISCGINDLQSQTGKWVDQFQALSIRLASMIVSQLVDSSETVRVERVKNLLNEVLNRPETPLAAFVHPEDFSKLQGYLKSVELDVQPDASVDIGECRVDYPSHELVSDLRQQLEQIEDRLGEVLHDV